MVTVRHPRCYSLVTIPIICPYFGLIRQSLMPRAASCGLWEVTRAKGRGAGGAGRGRRWHLPDLSWLQHSFRYLTPGHPDTRTSSFKAHRVVRAVYINRDSSIEAQASLKSAHGERLLLPPLGAASPAAPGFLACLVPRLLPLPGHGHLRTPGLHGAQPSEFTGAGRAAPSEERTSDVRFSSGCLAGVGAQSLPL